MQWSLLRTDAEKRVLVLDPRTKILLLVTIAVFVLGGVGNENPAFFCPVLCLIPFILLIISRRIKAALTALLIYLGSYLTLRYAIPHTTGIINYLLLGTAIIIMKLMPGVVTGIYVFSSTTVSEFTAAMQRMHVSETITIPLSVMFRFFPTVAEEFSAINDAMRIRGVSFGGGHPGKMLEYRLIPLMICSVNIGQELSAAALTRGLGGKVRRTNVCRIGFHFADLVVMVICSMPYAALLLSGFGLL
jgi:energy-coupling factor transporter transmembrane protein EcfT